MIDKQEYVDRSKSYYDKRFGNTDKGKELNSEEKFRLAQIKKAIEDLKLHPSRTRILDFGCGRGWLAQELVGYGDVYGIDLSEDAIQGAKELYQNVTFASADLSEMTIDKVFPGVDFNVLVSSEVIEHVMDQDAYLLNAFNALSPSGTFILTTPNGDFKEAYFDGERKDWGQPYEFWLKQKDLSSKFKNAGFEVLNHRVFNATWLLNVVIYKWNWMKFFENRLIRSVRYRFNLNDRYVKWVEKYKLGLYQIIVARKR